jgi:hypothetical protein
MLIPFLGYNIVWMLAMLSTFQGYMLPPSSGWNFTNFTYLDNEDGDSVYLTDIGNIAQIHTVLQPKNGIKINSKKVKNQ